MPAQAILTIIFVLKVFKLVYVIYKVINCMGALTHLSAVSLIIDKAFTGSTHSLISREHDHVTTVREPCTPYCCLCLEGVQTFTFK